MVGGLVAVLVGAVLALTLGLTGTPVGVADNADGARLFCAGHLVPDTPQGTADWRGVVVTDFRVAGPGCVRPAAPSSAVVLFRATLDATWGGDATTWSLVRLGVLDTVLVALATGVAAAAASTRRLRHAVVVALPVLPLVAVPWWSRFFVSTYLDAAGLLGTVAVLLGGLALAVQPPGTAHRVSRLAALGLVVLGGVVAGTAKPGYVPVALAAVVLAAATVVGRRWWRLAGPLAALAIAGACAAPVTAALTWQDATYGAINSHDLVFTAVLPEVGPSATAPLGLPPAADARAGEGFYVAGGAGIPGWPAAIAADPARARTAALGVLADHPGAVVRMVGHGLTATLLPRLDYLPSVPRGHAPEFDDRRTVHPEAGPFTGLLLARLAQLPVPWLPAAVAGACVLAGALTMLPRWRRARAAPLLRVAALTALAAVGIVVLAVLGDGYYELTKHVWLASYALLVAGLTLVAGVAGPLLSRRAARSPSTPAPPRTAAGTGR